MTTTISGQDDGWSIATQADGKILVAGTSRSADGVSRLFVIRHNTDGSIDSTFGVNGVVLDDQANTAGKKILVRSDGKILVGGEIYVNNAQCIYLTQFNSDGKKDKSFGINGNSLASLFLDGVSTWDISLQKDGTIVTVGNTSGITKDADIVVAIFNSDGALKYSNTKNISPSLNGWYSHDYAYSVANQEDGKILVAGTHRFLGNSYITVIRYTASGDIDDSFGKLGVQDVLVPDSSAGSDLVIQPDGKILVVGSGGGWGMPRGFAVARLNSDGTLDTKFSGDGILSTKIGGYDYGSTATTVALQKDGKILVGGANSNGSFYALNRYNRDGSLDTSFDSDGLLTTQIGQLGASGNELAIQADGKILFVGTATSTSTEWGVSVVRYLSNGKLDTSFAVREISPPNNSSSYEENASPIVLNENILIRDPELNGIGNYNGASVTLFRRGGADPEDVFSIGNNFSAIIEGSLLAYSGTSIIGIVTQNSSGKLVINFNSNANQNLVNFVLQSVGYQNSSDNPPETVQIEWHFNDGNTGIQGSGGSLSVTGSTTVDITPINDLPIGSNKSISVLPTSAYTLQAADFGFLDSEDGTSLAAVKIDSLPTNGKIFYKGAWVTTAGLTFTAADIASGDITYLPSKFSSSFSFKVMDKQGAYDTSSKTLTLNVNNPASGILTISGDSKQGKILSCTNNLADVDGLGTISFTWKAGATVVGIGNTYTLQQADVGKGITVTASYTDGYGSNESVTSAPTALIQNINDLPTGSVTISGTARQGQTLTAANSLADVDGLGEIAYTWKAGSTTLGTGSTYTLGQSDVGRAITVIATYTDGYGAQESVSSSSTSPVLSSVPNNAPVGLPALSGNSTQGQRLLADYSKVIDKDGLPKGLNSFGFTWFADDVEINGASSNTLTLGQTQVGKAISVVVSYIDLKGTTESITSLKSKAVTNVNDAPTGSVSISGTATQGQTLSASNTITDLDGVGTISYQWIAGGKAIAGATSDSFTLTQAQVNQSISVSASYTDGFGKKETVFSSVTSRVVNTNDAPTGQVTLSGTATEDQTLRAVTTTVADVDGMGPLRVQWQASSDGTTWTSINKATAATYKLGDTDVGKYVRVNVSYTDKLGTAESVLGESSALIANVNDKPVGVPTISGRFIEGETLTANTSRIKDADGLGSFSYQWQTSTDKKTWVDAGTDATFQLSGTSAKQFVQLITNYTDGNGTAESVKSTASAAIATKALTLLGGTDADTLTGWSGADRITGGGGADTLTGGAGADIFVYRSVDDSLPTSFDNILDFSAADKIDLKGIDAMTSRAGDQAFAFSRNGAAKNAVWWDAGTLYGDNTGDAAADFAIYVNLVGLSDVKASNIIL